MQTIFLSTVTSEFGELRRRLANLAQPTESFNSPMARTLTEFNLAVPIKSMAIVQAPDKCANVPLSY